MLKFNKKFALYGGKMHRYAWKCADCAVMVSHVSESLDPYRVGFEIYGKHAQMAPRCKNRAIEIRPSDAVTLINSESFQAEFKRFGRHGGHVEVSGNALTLYSGIMPDSTANAFADLLKRLDRRKLLDIIVVSTKDRP